MYDAKRKEFSTTRFHKQLPDKCGKVCVNCGDDREIEYHHIVPLECGGTNAFTNIVPLCRTCHMSVHMSKFIKAKRNAKLKKVSGRKRCCPDNYKEILDDFFHCRISKSKCVNLLGMEGRSQFTDTIWFKEYKRECGIDRYRNNIDLLNTPGNHGVRKGVTIGWILYENGKEETFSA